MNVYKSYTGLGINENDIASPCGLMAKNYFNDFFELYSDKNLSHPVNINQTGIVWSSTKGRYK